MPYKARVQSIMNKTDNCSSGNQEAGLVNTSDFSRIPRNILKAKTPTNYQFSALTGAGCYTATTTTTTTSDDAVSSNTTTIVVTVVGGVFFFDDVQAGAPDSNITLADGETVIYDQSDATNAGNEIAMFFGGNVQDDAAVLNYTGTAGVDGKMTVTYAASMPQVLMIGTGTDDSTTSTMSGSSSISKA